MRTDLIYTQEESREMLIVPTVSDTVRVSLTARVGRDGEAMMPYDFYADMLERGCERYSKTAYETLLESKGIQLSLSGSFAHVDISITTRREHLDSALSVLEAVFAKPLFLDSEIETLRKKYLQHIHEERDDSRGVAYGAFKRRVYRELEWTYAPTAEERERKIKRLSAKDLMRMHARFHAAPWVLSVASDPSTAERVFTRLYAYHTRSTETQPVLTTPELAPSAVVLEHIPEKQNIEFIIGNRLPLTRTDDAFRAVMFGLYVLGYPGGFAGRLMQTVREKEGLTYGIYATLGGANAWRTGHWNIGTFFTAADTQKGIASTLRELRGVVGKGITKQEHTRFAELMTNKWRMLFEATGPTLGLYHDALVDGRSPNDINATPGLIEALTIAQVNDALKTHIDPKRLVISGAGAVKDLPTGYADELRAAMA